MQSLHGFQSHRQSDEDRPIPFGSGTSKGHEKMWEAARAMTDDRLKSTWDCLVDYSPCDYYDRENGIGMDDWANCISAVMDQRQISHFA